MLCFVHGEEAVVVCYVRRVQRALLSRYVLILRKLTLFIHTHAHMRNNNNNTITQVLATAGAPPVSTASEAITTSGP